MKTAIVTGSEGLVGKKVVDILDQNKINVLCLGRNKLSEFDVKRKFGKSIPYIDIDMSEIDFLSEKIKSINFELNKEIVFYNFAWGGESNLTNGGIEFQLKNAINSSKAVKVAKSLGCKKFINCGTIQETIAENSISENILYNQSQIDYCISKIASRDMCSMVAYLEKIDYVHTRLSVPIDPLSYSSGYIINVLKKILRGDEYEDPSNSQLFDLTHIDDVARAYYLLGMYGKNKTDYYIGSSSPLTLKEYFYLAKKFKSKSELKPFSNKKHPMYSIETLMRDTGFKNNFNYKDILNQINKG